MLDFIDSNGFSYSPDATSISAFAEYCEKQENGRLKMPEPFAPKKFREVKKNNPKNHKDFRVKDQGLSVD